MEYAGGESGPRQKFEKQSSDSALGEAAELVYGGAETRRSGDGGAASNMNIDPNGAHEQQQRRMSGPAVAPLAFQQRSVGPSVPLAFQPQSAAPAVAGGPPVSQLLHQHVNAGTARPREAIGLEYSQNLNDAHMHAGPASRAAAVAEAGRRRDRMNQEDAHYGQMNESSRTINVYENMMMPSGNSNNNGKNRAPRRKKRGNRHNGNKPAAQRAAEEDEEYKRQREAYMSSNIYAMTSAEQGGGAADAMASPPQRGEDGYTMHTHTLALTDAPAEEGETIGRKVGRIARRMSFGALSAVSGLTGPGDSMYGDSSSSSESSDGEHEVGQRRYGGGINTMGKIGFDGPATGAWDGDMAPMPPSGAQNEEEMMLQHHHANWEKPKQWKPPEEPTLGRNIGRMARRMSGGAMSAGVLSALGGDSDEEGVLRRGQRKASSINLSTLARLDFDGLSDDQDPTGRQTNMENHVDARIAAEHGEIASAGGSAGNAVPFTIDVGSRVGRRQSANGRRAGRRRSRGSYSPSGPTSLRDLPIFNAVADINPSGVDVGAVQTSYYQDAREGARKAVKKGKKMARRMSSGSLSAMGFSMTVDDDDSDSSDDAPEPGDADYVPPPSAAKSVSGRGGNGYAKIGNETDDAVPSRGPRAPRRGSLANYIRVSARKLHESGIGEFDPDNIVTIGMDDEAEEHELEMQKRRRISLCVAIGILVAVVAALAGGTAKVFMWWGPGSSSDSISVVEQPGELPEPPTDLDRVCSVRNMATEAGHKDCEKLCSPATCCMKSGEDSCYAEHESLCEKYSYCGTLYTYTETAYGDTATKSSGTSAEDLHITPPPANLDDMCSDSSLETPAGYLDCLSTCHHGSCCVSLRSAQFGGEGEFGSTSVPSIQSCRDSHADICDAYEPCLKLWEAGHTDPVQIVKDVCTKKSVAMTEGRDQCESLCRARSCCFAQDDRNCRVDNKNWCDDYSACEVLIDERPSTSTINYDGPSEPKADECDQSKITTSIGLLMCEESCMLAACPCFGDVSDWNCGCKSTGDSINCKEWEYCRPLLANLVEDDLKVGNGGAGNVKNNEILQSISFACNKDNIKSSKGKEECFELCEDKMCCFGGCQDDAECGLYANCWNLLDTSDGGTDSIDNGPKLRPPPDDLDELCDPSTLDQSMRQTQCKEACSIGQCCMGIGFSCQSNIKYCLQFAACDVIWEPELYSPVGGKIPESTSKEVSIGETCALNSLKSPQGQEACDKACSDWSCCWDKNENCFDEHPSICVEYMVCPDARRLL